MPIFPLMHIKNNLGYSTVMTDIFGEPGKGIHKHVCGVAIADVILTGLAAVVIARVINKLVPLVFGGLIVLGTGVRGYFGVDTALNRKLGFAPGKQEDMKEVDCHLVRF
jgi:hypothetical protein